MKRLSFASLLLAASWALPALSLAQGGLAGALGGRPGSIGSLGRAGGQVEVLAREQYFDDATSTFVFEGEVEARQEGVFSLKAERVVYYRATGWIQAEGAVELELGSDVLSGDTATYNLQTGRAKIRNVHAVLQPSLILEAESVEKLSPHPRTGQDRYFVEQGTFTSCHRPGTGWNLHARQALIHMDNYLQLYGVVFRARGVPLMYLPYFLQSIRRGRTTGFLPPRIGFDSIWGVFLNLEFFWAIRDWLDLSLAATTYGPSRLDVSSTLRFRLSPKDPVNQITFGVTQVFDAVKRLSYGRSIRNLLASLDHRFPLGIQSRASAFVQNSVISDDPNLDPRLRTRRYNKADLSVSRSWGSQNLRLLGTFIQGLGTPGSQAPTSLILKLPSLAYSSGTPWSIFGSALKFGVETATLENIRRRDVPAGQAAGLAEELDLTLWRLHFVPTLQSTLTLPGVSIQPSLSLLETYYSRRREVDPRFPRGSFGTLAAEPVLRDSGPGVFIGPAGDGIFRHLYRFRVNLTGPSFYRLFDTDTGKEGKLKHLIQPTAVYQYSPFVDETEVVDTADLAIDRLGATSHSITYGLSNALLYKAKSRPTPAEILRFDVRQTYFLIDEAELRRINPSLLGVRQLGDLGFGLQVKPGAVFNATVNVALESSEWRPRTISADVGTAHARWALRGRYFRAATFRANPEDPNDPLLLPTQHSASLNGELRIAQHWRLRSQGIYNILDRTLSDGSLELGYGAQCWGISLGGGIIELRRLGPMTPVDRSFSVSFSFHLKNLGSLGTSQRLN